jgi:hypothetical protein
MRKKYCTPEYEIDLYSFNDYVMTSGLGDAFTEAELNDFSEKDIDFYDGGEEY